MGNLKKNIHINLKFEIFFSYSQIFEKLNLLTYVFFEFIKNNLFCKHFKYKVPNIMEHNNHNIQYI